MTQTTASSALPPDTAATIRAMAEANVFPRRAPILATPADRGLAYEDVFFPSLDGVPLEAWLIPAASDKLVIVNHPMTMNRYGFPGHLEPWRQFSDVTVDFTKVYAHLHAAGYNVLTYDMRNHGTSGTGNGGVAGTGLYEWRDVVGAMRYVQQHPRLEAMKVGLLNHCAGGNAAMVAMSKQPEAFKDVRCFVCPQPCSMGHSIKTFAAQAGIADHLQALNDEQCKLGGFSNDDMSPHPYAPDVKVPTFITQVRDDAWTTPEDVQKTFDLLTVEQKKLYWIEGTTRRFDGYNYFGEHPEQMLEFLAKHMA